MNFSHIFNGIEPSLYFLVLFRILEMEIAFAADLLYTVSSILLAECYFTIHRKFAFLDRAIIYYTLSALYFRLSPILLRAVRSLFRVETYFTIHRKIVISA